MRTPQDLSKAALHEQLSEEAIELAHAAQKMARKLRNENPTPVPFDELAYNVVEELSDVMNVADVLSLTPSMHIQVEKMSRWTSRLNGSI